VQRAVVRHRAPPLFQPRIGEKMTTTHSKSRAALRTWFTGLPFARSAPRKVPVNIDELPVRLREDIGINRAVIISALLTR
jgi:hypothetical protein